MSVDDANTNLIEPVTEREIKEEVAHYMNHLRAFDLIDDVLARCLKNALAIEAERQMTSAGRPPGSPGWTSFTDAKLELGIYVLSRRVKDAQRLEEKLVKWASSEKPREFRPYFAHVHDIVGNKIVCLHPADVVKVALAIKRCCDGKLFCVPDGGVLKPYLVRHGTFTLLNLHELCEAGFETDKLHRGDYTSIHFVFRLGEDFIAKLRPANVQEEHPGAQFFRPGIAGFIDPSTCMVEIQVRTILEEAWTEVDHAIRYHHEHLADDEELLGHARAMAGYIQAGNQHISIIRDLAKEKKRIARGE